MSFLRIVFASSLHHRPPTASLLKWPLEKHAKTKHFIDRIIDIIYDIPFIFVFICLSANSTMRRWIRLMASSPCVRAALALLRNGKSFHFLFCFFAVFLSFLLYLVLFDSGNVSSGPRQWLCIWQ